MNRDNLILALIASLSSLVSTLAAYYFFPHNTALLMWAVFFGLFPGLYRVGASKIQQIFSLLCYIGLTLLLIMIVTCSLMLLHRYILIIFTILSFICLCFPRYVPGSTLTSTFLVIFMVLSVFVYHSTNPHSLSSAVLSPLIACAFGGTATILLTMLLPKAVMPVVPCNKDRYVFKKAFRLTVIINTSFLLSYFLHVQNVIWVVLSAIVVIQQNIGASIKRSCERLLGTFIGIVLGTILAHFIFRHYPDTLFSAYILIFLVFLCIQRHYVLSMSFLVLLLAIAFFLLKPAHITVNHFLVARLLDTLLGIIIGLMGELLIFPRSLFNDVRNNIKEILLKFSQTLHSLSVSDNKSMVETHLASIEKLLAHLKQKLNDYRYEPLTMLSKRRYYIHQLYQLLFAIYQEMLNLNHSAKQTKQSVDCLSFNDLNEAVNLLANLSLEQFSGQINQCLIVLERQSRHASMEDVNAATLTTLNRQIKRLALLYQTILKTPCWLPRWA